MRCDYILTGVINEDSYENGPSSYFVVTEEQPNEFFALVAELAFPVCNMNDYLEGLAGGEKHKDLCVLVSLDGTKGIFRGYSNGNIEIESVTEEVHPFFIREGGEHVGVSAGSFHKLVMALPNIIAEFPALSGEYQFLPDPKDYSIERRFDISQFPMDLSLNQIDSEISEAARNPHLGTNDALALLYISSDPGKAQLNSNDAMVEAEIDRRITNQGNYSWNHFDFSSIEKLELSRRRLRAHWNLQKLEKAFGRDCTDAEEFEAVARYLRSLDDDTLVELAMVGFYRGIHMKPLVMALSERLPLALETND